MNKFVLLVLGLLFLTGIASAYQITIYTPETLAVGKPLIVTGTTTFGVGTPIDVVLYYQVTTSTEVKRKIAYVQSDKTFRVVFDTTPLRKGVYKVEVPANGLGDSITMRLVELIDRTDEIQMSSLEQQLYTGTLHLAGILKGSQNSGVQIEVTGPDGSRIMGPQYISTNYQGYFSVEVPIALIGVYDVSFTDAKGFIGTRSVSVTGTGEKIVPAITSSITTLGNVNSAHARASRDIPAYFEVKAGSNRVNVYTSSQTDWVMEYIDDHGTLRTVNDHGELNPEEIEVQGKGKSIFFKVYPYKYSDSGVVFLYAENVQSVSVSPTVPSVFGGGTGGSQTPSATQKAPIPIILGVVALLWSIFSRQQ
jgi:hypothetical protein